MTVGSSVLFNAPGTELYSNMGRGAEAWAGYKQAVKVRRAFRMTRAWLTAPLAGWVGLAIMGRTGGVAWSASRPPSTAVIVGRWRR